MPFITTRWRLILAITSSVLLVATIAVSQPKDRDAGGQVGSEIPPLPQEITDLIARTEPSPDCASESASRPADATVALDVVRVEGSCFDVETVWATDEDAGRTAERLREEDGVIAVSATPPVSFDFTEEMRVGQWGLDAIGSDRLSLNPWPTGKGVKVAVIDSGIDAGHSDLAGRVTNRRHFDGEDEEELDPTGHGTGVAGIIAANADRAGIYGVVPEVSLLDVPVWGSSEPGGEEVNVDATSWVGGLVWAVNNGADVANISLGTPDLEDYDCSGSDVSDELESDCLLAAQAAAEFAWHMGTAVVASGGNSGDATEEDDRNARQYPARLTNVVAVGALESEHVPAPSTTLNEDIDLMAPGSDITTLAPRTLSDPDLLESYTGQPYRKVGGASAAAPFVTGALAALRAAAPDAGIGTLEHVLAYTTSDVNGTEAGLIDIPAALRELENLDLLAPMPPVPPVVYGVAASEAETVELLAYHDEREIDLGTIGPAGGLEQIRLSLGGTMLAVDSSAGAQRLLILLDLADGTRVEQPIGQDCEAHFLGDSGKRISKVCPDRIDHLDPETLEVIDSSALPIEPLDEWGSLRLEGVSEDRLLFSEFSAGGIQRLWTIDPGSGELLLQHEQSRTGVLDALLSADGSRLAMVSGSTAGACGASYEALLYDAATFRPISSGEPLPGEDEDYGTYLGGLFFNGDALQAEPRIRDFTDYPNNCAGVDPESGGLWQLDEDGWSQISEDYPGYFAPLASVGGEPFHRTGVFVGDEFYGETRCRVVVMPWMAIVHHVDDCLWQHTVTVPTSQYIDLGRWKGLDF